MDIESENGIVQKITESSECGAHQEFAISFRAAAGPPESLGFTLVGALVIIPFILVYSTWSYYVFRGKVKIGEGYH